MHSRHYLRSGDFRFLKGAADAPEAALVPDWSVQDRLVVVAPDPLGDLAATASLVLALTRRFYDRPAAREPGFFDYPSHFAIGGEQGAAVRLLGPEEKRWWSAAWCRLDVWPSTHHAVAEPSPDAMLRAVLMLEPTRLLWPERLALPVALGAPAGPGHDEVRCLLHNRLKQVILYSGPNADGVPSEGSWSVRLGGTSLELAIEAVKLAAGLSSAPSHPCGAGCFRCITPAAYLGAAET